MNRLLSLVFLVTSGSAIANCNNYSDEYIFIKELIATNTHSTQVSGGIAINSNEVKSEVKENNITTDTRPSTESCSFDPKIMPLIINYKTNNYQLTKQHQKDIKKYFKHIGKDKNILVEGHTDAIGSTVFNDKLSKKRAFIVMKYIKTKLGLDNRIVEKFFGESNPICGVEENIQSGCNRRVVITLEDIG